MSSDDLQRQMEFIIEQQAKFSLDIEQLKEVQKQQTENLNSLTENVEVMRVEMRDAISNLIVANEVTRDLAEQATKLAIQNSQRITKLEEKLPDTRGA